MDQQSKSVEFIQVEFLDGSPGAMGPAALDLCLRQERIRRFRRADGWVIVGMDPMRGSDKRHYSGPERRAESRSGARNSTRLS